MDVVRWDRDQAVDLCDVLALEELDRAVLVLEGVSAADDDALGWIRRAPCVVIGIARRGVPASAAVDLALASDEGPSLDELTKCIRRSPHACRVLVDVLRSMPEFDVTAGVMLESLAYSALLAGPEFASWLEIRGPRAAKEFRDPPVRVQRAGNALRVTLSRPENRNAFSAAMRDALFDALIAAAIDPTIREVVVDADGPAFSSGGELAEFGTTPDVVLAHEIRTRRSIGAVLTQIAARTVVEVHGSCVGAGVELPAFADHVIADADTTFRLPEIAMGLIPGAGGTVSITRRIGRQRTARLAISGETITAADALAIGLVDEVRSSNGTSNGSVATGHDVGVHEGTSHPRNTSSEALDDTGEDGPTGRPSNS